MNNAANTTDAYLAGYDEGRASVDRAGSVVGVILGALSGFLAATIISAFLFF
jgi:hypothetical protein